MILLPPPANEELLCIGFTSIQLLLLFLGRYLGGESLGRVVVYLTGSEQSTVLLLGEGWVVDTDGVSTLTLTVPLPLSGFTLRTHELAEEMAPHLKAPTALPEDLSWVSSTLVRQLCSSKSRRCGALFWNL